MIEAVRVELPSEITAPGEYCIRPHEDDPNEFNFWFGCPHCGQRVMVPVRTDGKQPHAWKWDGDSEAPTLHPSLDTKDHWHGWLRNGYWMQA